MLGPLMQISLKKLKSACQISKNVHVSNPGFDFVAVGRLCRHELGDQSGNLFKVTKTDAYFELFLEFFKTFRLFCTEN